MYSAGGKHREIAAVQESWLETSLDFLNRYSRMSGDVLKVVQDLVAWQGVTKPLNPESSLCVCTASMNGKHGERDTALLVFVYGKRSKHRTE